MDFEKALKLIKKGSKLRRKGWDKSKLSIFVVHNATYPLFDKTNGSKLTGLMSSFIAISTNYSYVIPWTPDCLDLLANDWEIVK